MRAKPRRVDREHPEQVRLCWWMRGRGILFMSIPNEGKGRRNPATVNRLLAAGMRKGAPDLVLLTRCPTDGMPVAVEMKAPKGGVVSPHQKEVHKDLIKEGWHVIIGKGADEAIEKLKGIGF